MVVCKNVPVISLIMFQEWMWLLALSLSPIRNCNCYLLHRGHNTFQQTGEFSSGQIENLATTPRQLHTADASLRRPPVPKTTVTGFLPRLAQVARRAQKNGEGVWLLLFLYSWVVRLPYAKVNTQAVSNLISSPFSTLGECYRPQ